MNLCTQESLKCVSGKPQGPGWLVLRSSGSPTERGTHVSLLYKPHPCHMVYHPFQVSCLPRALCIDAHHPSGTFSKGSIFRIVVAMPSVSVFFKLFPPIAEKLMDNLHENKTESPSILGSSPFILKVQSHLADPTQRPLCETENSKRNTFHDFQVRPLRGGDWLCISLLGGGMTLE